MTNSRCAPIGFCGSNNQSRSRVLRPAVTRPFLCFLVASCLLCSQSYAEWSASEDQEASLAVLNEQQTRFIESGDILDFIPERQLDHELATREPESLQAWVDELISLANQMGYNADRDMGAIPLNLASKRYNSPLPTPQPLRDFERESGPFSVHRYLFPQSGIPTFGGAAVAIWPEDLVAGQVDVAIAGVPSNMSSGRRDAAAAPNAMRALNTIAATDQQSLLKPLEVLSVVDYGNLWTDLLSVERSIAHVTSMVAETAATGAIPMLVGGDTSMLFPGVKGVAEHRGSGEFGLLHFSAHADVERFDDHIMSDQQAVFALLDQDVIDGSDTILVGLRGTSLDQGNLQWLRSQRVRYHTQVEMQRDGFKKVSKKVMTEVSKGPASFFVSIDVSVIEPSQMIAAGRVVANGMALSEVTAMIREVCAAKDIVGFEITDLAPMMDLSRLSVLNANAILNACLGGIAVRRAGFSPDYIHPLVESHGQR